MQCGLSWSLDYQKSHIEYTVSLSYTYHSFSAIKYAKLVYSSFCWFYVCLHQRKISKCFFLILSSSVAHTFDINIKRLFGLVRAKMCELNCFISSKIILHNFCFVIFHARARTSNEYVAIHEFSKRKRQWKTVTQYLLRIYANNHVCFHRSAPCK